MALAENLRKWKYILPLVAMAAFVLLYVISAYRYPGGSWAHPAQEGFSWQHNYLCDLLDTLAVNGTINSGRYWARVALAVLCLGLAWLWYFLPGLTRGSSRFKGLLRLSGLAAFGTTVFLGSGTHDVTVRIAGAFGLFGLGCLLIGMWKDGRKALTFFGLWCLVIFLVNYAIYETGNLVSALPMIQKITFASFLAWFVWMDLTLYKRDTEHAQKVSGTREIENQFNP